MKKERRKIDPESAALWKDFKKAENDMECCRIIRSMISSGYSGTAYIQIIKPCKHVFFMEVQHCPRCGRKLLRGNE